jgi:type II secretory pathway component PulK
MRQKRATTDHGLRTTDRKGTVLLVVLVVVVMLALAAYQYSGYMTSEYQASVTAVRAAQARALADSGVHYAAALLSNPSSLNGSPYNNPGLFLNQGSDSSGPGRFTLIAVGDPNDPSSNGQLVRYGVIDEAGKINLNALLQIDKTGNVAKQILMALPNMTDEISDSILDWLDADDDPRQNGAESTYYSGLNPPYQAKNGPIDSLEELLLVKGVTPQLLYGDDVNRTGLDSSGNPVADRGWSMYLTVLSREQDLDSQGNPRIYINNSDTDTLASNLSTALQNDDLVNFILAYRAYGPDNSGGGSTNSNSRTTPAAPSKNTDPGPSKGGSSPSRGGASSGTDASASSRGGAAAASSGSAGGKLSRSNIKKTPGKSQKISSLYDLIDAKVTIPGTGGSKGTTYNSPLSMNDTDSLNQLLPLLLDKTTTTKPGTIIPPRVNVATAPAAVLQALAQINQNFDVNAIVSNRPSLSSTDPPDPVYQTPAWLITKANFSVKTLKAIDKYINSRSQVYRVQAIGYFPKGGPSARVEAVIDTNAGWPRIIFMRDLTALGPGMDISSLSGN